LERKNSLSPAILFTPRLHGCERSRQVVRPSRKKAWKLVRDMAENNKGTVDAKKAASAAAALVCQCYDKLGCDAISGAVAHARSQAAPSLVRASCLHRCHAGITQGESEVLVAEVSSALSLKITDARHPHTLVSRRHTHNTSSTPCVKCAPRILFFYRAPSACVSSTDKSHSLQTCGRCRSARRCCSRASPWSARRAPVDRPQPTRAGCCQTSQ
jgi:hypothetical protein